MKILFLIFAFSSLAFADNYAQVKSGKVQNVVVINDISLIPTFSAGFDCMVKIDNLNPKPGIDWTTSDNCVTFGAPVYD